MNGVILVNKEENRTSRDIVNDLIHIFNTKKIGHTGTLDPIATGVLVVCIGNCTKLVEILTANDKEYIATIKLGIKTDTGDITGNIIQTQNYNVNKTQLEKTLHSFVGKSIQTVPIYSAIKVNGKKLYEYARQKENVVLPTREINVYNIELLSFTEDEIKFKVLVSKGTYIRSLIEDICKKLNTVGTMSSLIRTKQGKFNITDSYSLDDIRNKNYKIITKEEILSDMETIELTENEYEKVKNGALLPKKFNEFYCAFKYHNEIAAVYQEYKKDKSLAKPYIMFL